MLLQLINNLIKQKGYGEYIKVEQFERDEARQNKESFKFINIETGEVIGAIDLRTDRKFMQDNMNRLQKFLLERLKVTFNV